MTSQGPPCSAFGYSPYEYSFASPSPPRFSQPHHQWQPPPAVAAAVTPTGEGDKQLYVSRRGGVPDEQQEESWMQKYRELEAFRANYGHCFVPFNFKENPVLGRWVRAQRTHYKLKAENNGYSYYMTGERIHLLQKIGFVWDGLGADWMKRWYELRAFQRSHGHTEVPINYTASPRLADWVARQRSEYKLFCDGDPSCVTSWERVEKMIELGFVWEEELPPAVLGSSSSSSSSDNTGRPKRKSTARADIHMSSSQQERTNLPNGKTTTSTATAPISSTSQPRSNLSNDTIRTAVPMPCSNQKSNLPRDTTTRTAAAASMSPSQERTSSLPNGFFTLATSTSAVATSKGSAAMDESTVHLPFASLSTKRPRVVINSDQERVKMQEKEKKSKNDGNIYMDRHAVTKEQEKWTRRFLELRAFKEEHGHCCVPDEFPENRRLARWVQLQRESYESNSLPAQRVNQLKEIEFVFYRLEAQEVAEEAFGVERYSNNEYMKNNRPQEVLVPPHWTEKGQEHYDLTLEPESYALTKEEEKWTSRFLELRAFKEEHGHCCVPDEFPENQRLARWVKLQRESYESNSLPEQRVKKLEEVGFVFDPEEAQEVIEEAFWLERYNHLLEFHRQHGHADVPISYPKDPQLADWVEDQRDHYERYWKGDNSSLMTLENMSKLSAIGFDWKKVRNKQEPPPCPPTIVPSSTSMLFSEEHYESYFQATSSNPKGNPWSNFS